MKDIFLNEKPVEGLVKIASSGEDLHCRRISDEIDATYSHTVNMLSRLEEEDLVRSHPRGRKKIYEPTDEGEELAESLKQVLEKMDENGFSSSDTDNELFDL